MQNAREHSAVDSSKQRQYLTFTLSGNGHSRARFGVSIEQVREVARAPEITRIPGTEGHVVGAASIRGEIVRIIDLAALVTRHEASPGEGFLVVTEDNERQQGFLVQSVESLLRVDDQDIHQLDDFASTKSNLIAGVAMLPDNELVTLLNLGQMTLAEQTEEILEQIQAVH